MNKLLLRMLERLRGQHGVPQIPCVAKSIKFETLEPRILMAADPIAINGAIDVAGEADQYHFNLNSDIRVVFDSLTDNPGIAWSLSGAKGDIVKKLSLSSSDSAKLSGNPVLDLTAGDYTITVSASPEVVGDYGFRLLDLQKAKAIVPGTSVTGQIHPGNQTDLYKFDALAGDHFLLDVTGRSGGDVKWQLLDPSGQQVFAPAAMNSASQDMDLAVLPATGAYTLLVEGQIGAQEAANYSFSAQLVPAACIPELGGATGVKNQTYAIERTLDTRAGVVYDLGFDYAGGLGLDLDHTRIGIYVDGVQIATHAGASTNVALNWESLSFSFTGKGAAQSIRIAVERGTEHGKHHEGRERRAMLDNIVLAEILPHNTGYQGGAIKLPAVVAALADTDGSEVLGVTIGMIPNGATLSDGAHSFTATNGLHLATVTGWNLDYLSITAPTGFAGTFDLTVAASSTETATGEIIDSAITLPVTVLPTNVMSLKVNHATAPEEQNGSWFLDLSQVAFCDGKTAVMADTYFETMHQPAPGAIKGKVGAIHGEWDVAAWPGGFVPSHDSGASSRMAGNFIDINGYTRNSACITLRFELEFVRPSLPSGAAATEIKECPPIVIDWSAKPGLPGKASVQADEPDKKHKSQSNWLIEFLGLETPEKQTAASLCNLKVVLKNEKIKPDK